MAEAKNFHFELLSLSGTQKSETSMDMSTSDESTRNDSLKSSSSPVSADTETPLSNIGSMMTNSFTQTCATRSSTQISCTNMERNTTLLEIVFNFPDAVVCWSTPTKTVIVEKGNNGIVGFKFIIRKGKLSDYLIVHSIAAGSPAHGKLKQGDVILSVNGKPMSWAEQMYGFACIMKNAGSPLKFVVQSPKKVTLSKVQNPILQEKWRQLNDKLDDQTKLKDKPTTKNLLNNKMASLPFLKLFILGKDSLHTALSLIGASCESEFQIINDVACCTHVDVKEGNSRYDWKRVTHNVEYFSDVIKSRLSSAEGESHFQDNVRLEVVSITEGHISESCYQLLLCKHAVYAIQFSVHELVTNPEAALKDIQKHLCKIYCYASSNVRVYLIGTQENNLSYNISDIGNILHNRFSGTYGQMLQYDPITNAPCFLVQNVVDHQELVQQGGTPAYRSRIVGECPNKQFKLYNMFEIRNHISKVAIRQEFIETSYPYRYLQLHKQVHDMRGQGSTCVLPGSFGLSMDEGSLSMTYLHDSGEIISAENLVFQFSTNATPNYLIMIDRQHLLRGACKISKAILESQCHPNDYSAWQQLKNSACGEKSFLTRLVGSSYEVDFLEVMSVIHCFQQRDFFMADNAPKEMYMVPVYLQEESPHLKYYDKYQLHQQLFIDFNGIIPDGLFWKSVMLIVQHLKGAEWSIHHRNSIWVHMPRQYEFVMESDDVKGIITINTMWCDTYCPVNLLNFIKDIFNTFTTVKCSQNLNILIGPPCPLSADECKRRRDLAWKTHTVDLSLYINHGSLYCGTERIDNDDHISPWILKKPSVLVAHEPDDVTVKCIRLDSPVFKLPLKVIQIICDNLNIEDPFHRNWEGFAGLLEYSWRQLRILKNNENPTAALLEDYSRQKNANFGGILKILEHKDLMRFDIIQEIKDNFEIVT